VFDDRRTRAAARLAAGAAAAWYFPLLNLEASSERFELGPAARLQRVTDPPTEAELAAALQDPRLFATLGRWAAAVRWELALDRTLGTSPQAASHLAGLIVMALRIRTGGQILLPAMTDHSWSTLAAIADGRCTAGVLEDVPLARRFDAPTRVETADLEWVWPRLGDLPGLLAAPRFRVAVDALAAHHHEANPRLAAVMLWAGLEALVGHSVADGFRMASRLAVGLEPPGPGRLDVYERGVDLVAMRSRVLVSELLAPADVESHVRDVRVVLTRLLTTVVDARRLPTTCELDQALFDPPGTMRRETVP
jgi:hypothetical protein